MRDCDVEFGEDHEHDQYECEYMLSLMNGDEAMQQYEDMVNAYSREAEEHMLGRPLFPNEY